MHSITRKQETKLQTNHTYKWQWKILGETISKEPKYHN